MTYVNFSAKDTFNAHIYFLIVKFSTAKRRFFSKMIRNFKQPTHFMSLSLFKTFLSVVAFNCKKSKISNIATKKFFQNHIFNVRRRIRFLRYRLATRQPLRCDKILKTASQKIRCRVEVKQNSQKN